VSNQYVSIGSSTTTNATNNSNTASQSKKIVITASSLNARSGASASSSVIGSVNKNEVYTYTSVKDGWYLIKLPSGQNAYVSGDYVKPFTSYAIDGGSTYIWPVQSSDYISSYFGQRNGKNHNGIDIAAGAGSQIIAVASGKVITKSYESGGYGYYIVIQQNDGICAYYAHMKTASFLSVGDTVNAGDTVGMVGSTGNSTGNHLHLEFRNGSTKINPLNYYPNNKTEA
jgi:murein DD-endopeptidase MepM/ murein hydrolase activator NlpD